MSHLHSLAQSMYIATFLPEHVLTTCFADYVTSTSGAIRLAFDLLPLASSLESRLEPMKDPTKTSKYIPLFIPL